MIAVDAMGGDFAPDVTVMGAINAARQGVAVTLFGDEERLKELLYDCDPGWQHLPLFIEHCSETVAMHDEPSRAILQKKDSSLVRAMNAVMEGRAQAFVSAGNSGAVLVAATLTIGRVPGVLRPAIGNFLPKKRGEIFCMDLGANTDCRPEYLEQFAHMAHVYVQMNKQISSPKIALLSNGAEPYKGASAVKEAYKLLQMSQLNFAGNIESRDIFDTDIDIVICDGFVGNVLLKGIQGTAKLIMHWLQEEAMQSWWSRFYFALGRRFFYSLKARMDYAKYGGALLLGVNAPVIIAHGSSSVVAIEQAIMRADENIKSRFTQLYNAALQEQFALSQPMRMQTSNYLVGRAEE
ncbi:MAG: phosphate acyltransferase PlsX [Candidatus Dependentiae bacterium]|nr:phosphate acyltransferase PlsX [Candidatus Dependentiae bacterium]